MAAGTPQCLHAAPGREAGSRTIPPPSRAQPRPQPDAQGNRRRPRRPRRTSLRRCPGTSLEQALADFQDELPPPTALACESQKWGAQNQWTQGVLQQIFLITARRSQLLAPFPARKSKSKSNIPPQMRVTVRDNGTGIDPHSSTRPQIPLGPTVMRERAANIVPTSASGASPTPAPKSNSLSHSKLRKGPHARRLVGLTRVAYLCGPHGFVPLQDCSSFGFAFMSSTFWNETRNAGFHHWIQPLSGFEFD